MSPTVPLARAEAASVCRWVTLGVPLLLVGLAFVPDPDRPGVHWESPGLGLLLLGLFHLAPRRLTYTLAPDALVIRRMLGRTALPYAGLRARRSAGRLGVRLFGTGLPGYLTGHFTFGPDPAPRVRAAASRGDAGVIVETGDASYFLTPADPDGFLQTLAAHGVSVAL